MRQLRFSTVFAIVAGLSLAACTSSGTAVVTKSPPAVAAACRVDTRVVDIAVTVLQSYDPHAYQHLTSAQWKVDVLGTALTGGPFLQRWPTGHAAYYQVSVAPAQPLTTTGDHVTTVNGDVIVTATSSGRTYDATVHPALACAGF
jgi:hypothetical protein